MCRYQSVSIASSSDASRRSVFYVLVLLAGVLVPSISPAQSFDDERDNLIVVPYVGIGIDSFAAGDVTQYLNQGESGGIEERATAGIEFSYRLTGDSSDSDRDQVWLYGRTTHGVRSTDVDCKASPDFPVCEPFSAELDNSAERGLYILRNSSSLEGIAGIRWEFETLQAGTMAPARAYLSAQLGFVAVSEGPDDAADVHHLGLGAVLTKGRYEGSFFEVGYGSNDLILENPNERYKVNARVVRKLGERLNTGVFAHISVDVDADTGSDSIQTYLGVYFSFGSDD